MLERTSDHTITNFASSLSPNNSNSRSINTMKGRKSPVPKLISETELRSQNWGLIDWIWWTAFNFSIGKSYLLHFQGSLWAQTLFFFSSRVYIFICFVFDYSRMPNYRNSQRHSPTTSSFTTSMVIIDFSILCQSLYFLSHLLPYPSISLLFWNWNSCNRKRRKNN